MAFLSHYASSETDIFSFGTASAGSSVAVSFAKARVIEPCTRLSVPI